MGHGDVGWLILVVYPTWRAESWRVPPSTFAKAEIPHFWTKDHNHPEILAASCTILNDIIKLYIYICVCVRVWSWIFKPYSPLHINIITISSWWIISHHFPIKIPLNPGVLPPLGSILDALSLSLSLSPLGILFPKSQPCPKMEGTTTHIHTHTHTHIWSR